MTEGFCEHVDVRRVLQDHNFEGALQQEEEIVDDSIVGVSRWFANATNGHWYDSGGDSADIIPTSSASTTNVRLDVPNGPHRKDRQLYSDTVGYRYPTTHNGPYAKIPLPHPHVQTVTALDVRDRGGDVEDWVASNDHQAGRGEDYYIERPGQASYGRTYLYIRADSIGPRVDYGGLLSLDYDYGLDYQTEAWDDVRRGVAMLAAVDLVVDDDVVTAIPDQGQLLNVDTKSQRLLDAGMRRLDPYLDTPIA